MSIYTQKYAVVLLYVRFEAPEGEIQVVKYAFVSNETIIEEERTFPRRVLKYIWRRHNGR